MDTEKFMKTMEICEKKFAETNWVPPIEFQPFRDLYKTLLSGSIKEKPKLERVLTHYLNSDSENWVSNILFGLYDDTWTLDSGLVLSQLAIEIPAIKFDDNKWLSASYMVIFNLDFEYFTSMAIFVQSMFITPDTIKTIKDICRIRGIHLDQNDIDNIKNVDVMTLDPENKSIEVGWRYQDDMDLEEAKAVMEKKKEDWIKVYQEIKYGLGL